MRRIADALAVGDQRAGLRELLILWNDTRNPHVADLIDRVQLCLTSDAADELLRTKNEAERERLWNAMADELELADVGALLLAWPKGKLRQIEHRFTSIERWPDDPRVALALARVLLHPPFRGEAALYFYRDVEEHLVRLRDARVLSILRSAAERGDHDEDGPATDVASVADRLDDELAADPPGPIDAGWLALLGASLPLASAPIESHRPQRRPAADGLLLAVYQNPEDDGLRLVCADVLEEAGDPRGELIALQFKESEGRARPSDIKRIAALVKRHGSRWLGNLGRLPVERVSFEKGFPARICLAPSVTAAHWRAAEGAPELGTVRALELTYNGEDSAALEVIAASSALASLRELHVRGPELLDASERLAGAPAFEHIHTFGYCDRRITPGEVARIRRAFPGVTRLRLAWTLAPDATAIHGVLAAIGGGLSELAVEFTARQQYLLLASLGELAGLPADLGCIEIASGPERWRVTRGRDGAWRAEVTGERSALDSARVEQVMEALPAEVPLQREVVLPVGRRRAPR